MKPFALFCLPAVLGAALLSGCDAPGTTDTPTPAPATETKAEPTAAPTAKPTPIVVNSREEAEKVAAVSPPDAKAKAPDKARVVLETNRGPITVELAGKEAPMHTLSFLHLVKLKFYDGTVFHRHADLSGDGKGFIIQGGDPFTRIKGAESFAGTGGPGYNIPLEVSALKHEKLVLSMARSQDPNSAGSQFYITQGPVHFLDKQYTVFGKVVDGKETALALVQGDKIKSARVVDGAKTKN